MTCPSEQQLRAFQLGDLSAPDLDQVAEHLEACALCEQLAQLLDTSVDPILAAIRDPEAPGGTRSPTRPIAAASTPNPSRPPSSTTYFPFLLPAVEPDEIGRLGNYRVLRLLGKGGMAFVFHAEDISLRRPVALKIMKPDLSHDGEGCQRFLREARIMASIKDEHLVTVYQVGQEGASVHLAMELLKGESLGARMDRQGKAAKLTEILRLGREIASGLAVVHQHGLVHRDIKPDNIWLEAPGGRVKILDFGLARFRDDDARLTQAGTVMGTPSYMSPEQARGQPVDARSDLFSLGCILYALCTGERPFSAENTMAALTALAVDTPQPILEQNPDIPPALADLTMQLLAKDPDERPGSAQEVIERLQAIESGSVRAVAPARPVKSRRWRWIAATGAIVSVLGLTLLAYPGCPGVEDQHASIPSQPSPTPPVVKKLPVKVFLLAGQNDMGGKGAIRTLDWLGQDAQHGALLRKIKNPDGTWVTRPDVWIYLANEGGARRGNLTVGYGQKDDEIGPELLFGHQLGDHFDNQVLLIKVTQGPMSLAVEGRPPSSAAPAPPGPFYEKLIRTARMVLERIDLYFPEYEGQGYEIAGFVWFAGWNDMDKPDRRIEYAGNLQNLIKDLRSDLGVPNLPVVIGELGVGGRKPNPAIQAVRTDQAAVARLPEFAGSVALDETSRHWDYVADALYRKGCVNYKWHDLEAFQQFEKMGSQAEFLYFGSGKIFALIGNGFGETMKKLLRDQDTKSVR